VGSSKRACLHEQTTHTWRVTGEHPAWDPGGDTRGSGSHLQRHATLCLVVYWRSEKTFPAPPVTTAFHTGMTCKCIVLLFFFVNQHFPGLPSSGS
jgi:hypothetical protein